MPDSGLRDNHMQRTASVDQARQLRASPDFRQQENPDLLLIDLLLTPVRTLAVSLYQSV
ncbi:MAG: hypothetical protein IT530_08065 [Burkholderiales bacterium]|nr:hypothetical protein [Burkholderiales bacterium]